MILVTDATGRIGSSVTRQLAAAGQHVRAFVPSLARASRLDASRTGLAVGSLSDHRALAKALDGVRVVVLITSGAPEQIAAQERVIVQARTAGVERIIKLSTADAGAAAYCESARWHGHIEDVLARSGIAGCSVRASRFMQSLELQVPLILTAGILTGCQGTGRVADIDVYDVASVLAELAMKRGSTVVNASIANVERKVGANDSVFEAFDLTGPAAFTRADAAAILSVNLGRAVSYVDCAPAELLQCAQAAGLPAWQAQDIVALETFARSGACSTVSNAAQQILGRPARDFASFAHEFAFSLRYSQSPGMLESVSPAMATA